MKILLIVIGFITLAGCASSSGVLNTGPDSYMVSREGGSAFVGTNGLRVDAMKEANAYCQNEGKIFQVSSTQVQGGGLGKYPHADIYFLCLSPGDPQLSRTNLVPTPNTVVEVRNH